MKTDIDKAEVGIYTFGKDSPNRPSTVQYIFEVAGLRDPQSNRGFSKTYKDGRPGEVQNYVEDDPRVKAIIQEIRAFAYMHLRSDAKDNKWLSFGIKDNHGRWIAPAVGELVAERLSQLKYGVYLCHCDLDKETK